jgi:uncharacterized membrane protein YfcA
MFLGVLIRNRVDPDAILLAAGVVTLGAVAARLRGSPQPSRGGAGPPLILMAGGLGGFLGVTTSLNGVPPALLLTGDRATARNMVADLAVYFVLGNVLSLLILYQTGHAHSGWVWSALLVWVPIGLVGNLLGVALGPRMPYAFFRRLTLGVIVASGLASSIQALGSLVG